MKIFIALFLTTVSTVEMADGENCSWADDTCGPISCCGTVTGTGAPQFSVCNIRPTDAELMADARGTRYVISAAVAPSCTGCSPYIAA